MKTIITFYSLVFIFVAYSCSSGRTLVKQDAFQTFLFKTEVDTSHTNFGQHIEIKQILPDTKDLIPMSIDDRDIIARSGYDIQEQIVILGEYLAFQGDTNKSNKRYHFKAAYYMTHPQDVNGFTIQIEALYSFTRMLMAGYPPIQPMLIDRKSGEELNTNPEAVKAVYKIYIDWYENNIKTGFKNVTLPLTGTPFAWRGEDKGLNPFLKKTL